MTTEEEIAQLRRDVEAADDRVESLRMDRATVEREREETQEWALRVAEENRRLWAVVEAVAKIDEPRDNEFDNCHLCASDPLERPWHRPHRADCPWLAARAIVDERARKEQP
jgi:hypothetical protein